MTLHFEATCTVLDGTQDLLVDLMDSVEGIMLEMEAQLDCMVASWDRHTTDPTRSDPGDFIVCRIMAQVVPR